MLLGAAIFPENSKYGGGPEKMAIVAARQRWRWCSGESQTVGFQGICRPQHSGALTTQTAAYVELENRVFNLREFF